MDKPIWSGGFQAGYNYGQNGEGWPNAKDLLANNNRGGFYIRQLRVKGELPFDSTFSAVLVGNIIFSDIQEAYLQKRWDEYRVKFGKFRGAGPRVATGVDEFDMTTIRRPLAAEYWNYYGMSLGFRDFGIQVERSFFGGRMENKLFFHNANGENVMNGEPSFYAGKTTQALGLDYEMDVQVSRNALVGGHIGALGDKEWGEFLGTHDFWRADYWFKTNPVVDFSAFHQLDRNRLHLLSQAILIYNRRIRVLPDSNAQKTWGVSSLVRYDAARRWSPFFRYEFMDPSDGTVSQDNLNLFTLGAVFRPAPESQPRLKATAEYVHTLEEDLENKTGNDILYAQLEMTF